MPFDFNEKKSPMDSQGANTPKTSSTRGFQNSGGTSAGGFTNFPERKKTNSDLETFKTPSTYTHTGTTYSRRTRRTQRNRPIQRREIVVPWRAILIVVGILIIIAALWVNRDAITAFLSQILSWVITIIVIIFLVKLFIFRR